MFVTLPLRNICYFAISKYFAYIVQASLKQLHITFEHRIFKKDFKIVSLKLQKRTYSMFFWYRYKHWHKKL